MEAFCFEPTENESPGLRCCLKRVTHAAHRANTPCREPMLTTGGVLIAGALQTLGAA
jgi:hypothetical protein